MSAYSDAVLAHGPLVYWRLGEASGTTANDASGNARHGTIEPGVTIGTTGLLTGDADTAMTFATGRVIISHASALNVSSATLIAWVTTTQTTSGWILGKSGEYELQMSAGTFRVYNNHAATGIGLKNSGVTINDGARHMVALTIQHGVANGTVLYVDGVPALTTSAGVLGLSNPLSAGGHSTNSGSRFVGVIDECALIPSILTASNIAALWSIGTTGGEVTTPLRTKIGGALVDATGYKAKVGGALVDVTVGAS